MIDTMVKSDKGAPVTAPEPQLINTYDQKAHGRWYAGARPTAVGDLPVVVFVPGLGDYATSFWGANEFYAKNNLYALALNDGFRTAYVSFMADGEKPYDMWRNGRIFAWQLEDICRYYKTESVVVVAHSKGGVDAQTAAVYFGAAPRISRLITLSSPHWGSQLADLAYSTFGWELAECLGQHSDGCFCMQTAYMRSYRKATDINPKDVTVLATFAGDGGAPAFTDIWGGSLFLSQYGENDGVVIVSSAQNPKGKHLATLPLNHVQMMTGQEIWPYLKPALLGRPLPAQPAVPAARYPAGIVFRGGRLDNGVADEFPVDSTVKSMEIIIAIAAEKGGRSDAGLQVFAPDGTQNHNFLATSGPFGTRLLRLTVEDPGVGNWHLIFTGAKGAYLAQINMNGTFRALPENQGGISGSHPFAGEARSVMRVVKTFADRYETAAEHNIGQAGYRPPLHLGDGAFTIESIIKGVLSDGSTYERDVLRPVLTAGIDVIEAAGVLSEII